MAGVSTSITVRDRVTARMNKITAAFSRADRAAQGLNLATVRSNAARTYMGIAPKVRDVGREVENVQKKQEQAAAGAKKVDGAWSRVRQTLTGLAAAAGIQKLLGLADSMTQTTARMDLMNDGKQSTAQLQKMVMASANRSRASYLSTADSVAKMGVMAKDAFGSNAELIKFSELINKQFAIAGTSAAGIDAAMLQLTQAMASGVLRGEELNSVFEQAPTIIQTVAEYLDVPIGQIRSMAAEGQITAEIVKNAMLDSADKIDERFCNMPMTFAQVGTLVQNTLLQAFDPAIQAIGQGAQWIYDNWSQVSIVLMAAAAGVGAFAAISVVWTAITWLQVAANRALMASMLTNPIFLVSLAIAGLVMLIANWVQSVGGLRIAWAITVDKVLTEASKLQIGFTSAFYLIQNAVGDLKVAVLSNLESMINASIDLLNDFISLLNKIPGVNIQAVGHVTFGAAAQAEHEAAKQDRANRLTQMQNRADMEHRGRQMTIDGMRYEAAQAALNEGLDIPTSFDSVKSVGEVGKINDDVNIADEDLKIMEDVAIRRYETHVNSTSLTPQVTVKVEGNADRGTAEDIADRIAVILRREAAAQTSISYAEV